MVESPRMEGEPSHIGQSGHRAVVWHAPEVPPPPNLMAALAGRRIEAVRVQSPYRALAELCRAGIPAQPAIVIVHPESLADVPAFWDAKARYAPGARCWMYGPIVRPVLRAIVDADIAAWAGPRQPEIVVKPDSLRIGPEPRRDVPRPRPAVPKLKLAGEPMAVPAEGPAEEASKAPLLSPEELRMLLGDDEPDAAGER